MSTYKHAGYFLPDIEDSVFATPIYVKDEALYIHSLDHCDKIRHFLRVPEGVKYQDFDGLEYGVGDTAIFAFCKEDLIISGSRGEISNQLLRFARTLRTTPHIQLEIASFLHSSKLAARAYQNAIRKGGTLASDEDFSLQMSSEFLIDIDKAGFEKRAEICSYLIEFYTSYRQLLSVKNSARRYVLQKRYLQRHNLLAEKLQSGEFSRAINRAHIAAMRRARVQMDLSLEYDFEYKLTKVLSRLGLKAHSASKLVLESRKFISSSDLLQHSKALSDSLNDMHLRFVVELEGVKALNRARKRVRKRHLAEGYFAILSGIMLLIQSESIRDSGSSYTSFVMRIFGYSAIKLGAMGLELPHEQILSRNDIASEGDISNIEPLRDF